MSGYIITNNSAAQQTLCICTKIRSNRSVFFVDIQNIFELIILAIYVIPLKLIQRFKRRGSSNMDDFFTTDDFQQHSQNQYAPPDTVDASEFVTAQSALNYEPQQFDFNAYSAGQVTNSYGNGPAEENEFNQFEEDEATKRIREEEDRIQNLLREKSEREWNDKEARKAEGRRQLEEYNAKKERDNLERAQENLQKEVTNKEELAKLNVEAGWRKVITNINVRQGEHKGKKEINRMREAILHRRQDDKR